MKRGDRTECLIRLLEPKLCLGSIADRILGQRQYRR
jgi:hypothetical protein